jgi:hypothetical protein
MTRLLVILLFFSSAALGHDGGLDSMGCHHDKEPGLVHCHRGSLTGQFFDSKKEVLSALIRSKTDTLSGSSSESETPQPDTGEPVESAAVPYDRDLYGDWIDTDGDCQDTRQEVLIAESLIPVQFDSWGCNVVSGQWLDPYTGQTFTDPSDLDIDHVVPLAEAHRSGASHWLPQLRTQFANDLLFPGSLIAVSASANRSKGDRDPADWLPPNPAFQCDYVRAWVMAKGYWGLVMDDRERSTVYYVLAGCEQPVRGLSH